jgi:hypothetical protein
MPKQSAAYFTWQINYKFSSLANKAMFTIVSWTYRRGIGQVNGFDPPETHSVP